MEISNIHAPTILELILCFRIFQRFFYWNKFTKLLQTSLKKKPIFHPTLSYICKFIRNRLPRKDGKYDKYIFALILMALLVATPVDRQTFWTNKQDTITSFKTFLKITTLKRNCCFAFFVNCRDIRNDVLIQLLMGLNLYLPARTVIGNIEFNTKLNWIL